jgi:hypothetical protein
MAERIFARTWFLLAKRVPLRWICWSSVQVSSSHRFPSCFRAGSMVRYAGRKLQTFPARASLAVLVGSRLRRTEMNDPSASAHIAESFEQRSATQTRLHGRWLVLIWIGWLLLVAYTLGVFFGSLPFFFAHLQTVCTRTPCISGQPLASTVLLLHGLGLSLASYALLMIVLIILVACIAFAVAGVLAWRKADDWLALLSTDHWMESPSLAFSLVCTARDLVRSRPGCHQ